MDAGTVEELIITHLHWHRISFSFLLSFHFCFHQNSPGGSQRFRLFCRRSSRRQQRFSACTMGHNQTAVMTTRDNDPWSHKRTNLALTFDSMEQNCSSSPNTIIIFWPAWTKKNFVGQFSWSGT